MEQIEPILSCDVIKTDVSCVKIFNKIILIGNGYYLYVYSRKENILQKKFYIFDENIFGININRNEMLVYGGKYLKIYRFDPLFSKFEELASYTCFDWITTAKFLNNGNYIVIVTMHNVVTLFDSSLCMVENKECMERCISYCSQVVGDNWDDLIILSGTVFSQILLWWPAKTHDKLCPVMFRLYGHKGVIFSINCNQSLNVICTTSDDRTAKLWFIARGGLREELCRNSIDIVCKHTLIGHTARVFKCKLLENTVITGGEDGLVNIWNINGELVRTVDVHQAGPVWSLDICEREDIVVTGGGDCGVFLFKLHLNYSKSELMRNLKGTPRRVLILSSDTLTYLTDRGVLNRYDIKSDTVTDIFTHDDLISYGLLERSPCRKLIALAGYRGELHLYKNSSKSLDYMYSCQIASKERIFALHWLSCSALLTCGANGVLILWVIDKTTMFPIQFWQLPFSKERWSNAACFCGNDSILIGDRRGALYLYTMNFSEPVQVIKRAHNYLGVTHVFYNKGRVISLGRNSTVNEYKMDTTSKQLTQISTHKVPFSWLAGLFQQKFSSSPFLIGFSSTNFVIYDYNTRRTLLETDCGGGHRSWDFHITDDQLVVFSYIKDNKIISLKCPLADIIGRDIIKGFHLNEINVLKSILTGTNDEVLFVSGGEDTVIRLCLKNLHDTHSDFRHLNVLKSHLSSIRTIAITKIENSKYYIFTGGGRAQIILWELLINNANDKSIVNCSEKYNYYEKSDHVDEAETRVMSMCTLTIEEIVYLLAAYSDGTVKVFKVDVKNDGGLQLILTKQIPVYKAKCIFQMSILSTGSYYLLITMASDGYIVFTDITQIFSNEGSFKCHTITSMKAHQSGINTFSYCKRNGNLFFLTGGDDTAIALNAFNLNDTDTIEIKHVSKFSDEFYHGAQVTGTYMNNKYFLTASIDQKVILFKWDFQERFRVTCLQEYSSSVCDIKGLECILVDDCVKIIVYGRGCEIINCNRTLQ